MPYRRITWNSIHLRTNPPEDAASLARNLGVWCFVFGAFGLLGIIVGAFSIMAAIAGIVSIYNAIRFFGANQRARGQLPGAGKAVAGIALSIAGYGVFILGVALRVVLASLR